VCNLSVGIDMRYHAGVDLPHKTCHIHHTHTCARMLSNTKYVFGVRLSVGHICMRV